MSNENRKWFKVDNDVIIHRPNEHVAEMFNFSAQVCVCVTSDENAFNRVLKTESKFSEIPSAKLKRASRELKLAGQK